MDKNLSLPEGEFRIFLQKEDAAHMRRPWVFRVQSPRGESFRGSARTRRGARHRIRKFVALEISEIRRQNKANRKREELVALLRRGGINEQEAQKIADQERLRCRQIAPGQIMCSWYSSSSWHGRGWRTSIYADGERIAWSESCRTRRSSRRTAAEELQNFYEKRLLGI